VAATLRNTLRLILLLAAITAIVGLLAGNRWVRAKLSTRQMPSWMTGGPVHEFVARHRTALQWTVLAVGLLVLVIWTNPTTLVAVVVVLVTLAAVGLVGLFAGRHPPGQLAVAPPGPPPAGTGDDAGGEPKH
ncbi:MAG TPA: hypothetical protein VG032_00450, partial [Acidimicrobiales bacterium]|nr:hypothetical protein [Acidimicrobiales bacterium]